MTGIAITITDKGRAALVAASGTNAVTISAIGISATSVTPTATATTLPGEIKRLATFSGTVTDADTIHVTIRDDSADSYALRAFALYLNDGTLFGLHGGDTLIMEKATGSMLMLAVDIQITGSDVTAITFGDTNFIDPPATTEVQGVVELATEAEAATGTDTKRAVTPKGMMTAVKSWLDDRFGIGAPSAFIKGLLAKTGAADVLTALGIKSAALKDANSFLQTTGGTIDGNLTVNATVAGITVNGKSTDSVGIKIINSNYAAGNFWHICNDSQGGLTFNQNGTDLFYIGRAGNTTTRFVGSLETGGTLGASSGKYSASDGASLWVGDGQYGLSSAGSVLYHWTATNGAHYFKAGDAVLAYIDMSGIHYAGNTVWHAGNDGSGSGLDADMLDGYHAASFLRATGTWMNAFDTYGYAYAFGYNANGGDITFMTKNGALSVMADGDYFAGEGGGFYSGGPSTRVGFYNNGGRAHFDAPIFGASRISVGWDSGENNSINCSGWFRSVDASGWYNQTYGGGWYMQDTIWVRSYADKSIYTAGRMRADSGFVVGGSEYPVFHSGNDGAGSGMDADTVDGKHASELGTRAYAGALDGTTRSDAATVWSGDVVRQITTGNALVLFHANWGTGGGPFYAQLYVDGSPWPGAVSEIGATGGSDFTIAPCTIMAVVTGLSSGNHTFAVKRTTGSDLTLYGGGNLVVLPTS